ncbi:MAG: replication-associated recombination protein A [Ruminococcaceae bacterium]|nr:replication-associated recombination protein A [Oscillospiraceae bacterium]
MYQPLADELRPKTLNEVYGQESILGEGKMLRRIIESGKIPNLIFYGPSGTGKTTVANIIAERTRRKLFKLNATTASTSDIREIVSQLDTMLAPNGVLLYLDEIQSFNKKQQQTLLEHIENGKITLIASTTENPYFYVFNAILSRSTVFEFKQLDPEAVMQAVRRAIAYMENKTGLRTECEPGALEHISFSCGGDLRKALNAVEVLFSAAGTDSEILHITLADAKTVTQRSAMRYDRDGDNHYDCLSALMKSIRGSDPDAAVHYLARFLEAGDLPACCRRILCSVCEDIGLAYPLAIPIVKACVDTALQLGMPEARLPLADAVVFLATCPKSNSAHDAIDLALRDVRKGITGPIPRELQNVHADSAGQEREQGYLYPHDYPRHWVQQQYLPDALMGKRYYEYGDNKTEQAAKRYWDEIKGGHG